MPKDAVAEAFPMASLGSAVALSASAVGMLHKKKRSGCSGMKTGLVPNGTADDSMSCNVRKDASTI